MSKKVFVSGCFDTLHSGHIAFFEEASKFGDLYVGLGADKTVYDLKGRKTIFNENERLYMVKSIRFVKDAWINSGDGLIDFAEEVLKLKHENLKMKEFIQRMSEQISMLARKEELMILQRQFDMFKPFSKK